MNTADPTAQSEAGHTPGPLDALRLCEAERDEWRKKYFDVADAVCRESTGVEDLCKQARETRIKLGRALESLEECAELLRARRIEPPYMTLDAEVVAACEKARAVLAQKGAA